MTITPETVISLVAALGVGGALGKLIDNRGNAQGRQSDELTRFRESLMNEIDELKAEHKTEIEQLKAEHKADMAVLKEEGKSLRIGQETNAANLQRVRIDFAQYRAVVRTMIVQIRAGDERWKNTADILSAADHDVDRLILQGEVPAVAVKRVLLIDDSPDALDMIQLCLRHSGYDVTTADGGAEGVQKFVTAALALERFNLVICDYTMPEMNGAEVVTSIRNYDGTTPIVFLTGHPDDISEDAGSNPFGCDVWSKPIDCNLLGQKVAETIGMAVSGA